jgi:signal transduction histidine kinase
MEQDCENARPISDINSKEAIAALAGEIAHDFGNILLCLFGNIELAKAALTQDRESSRYLDQANRALHRAQHLTRQLLTIAKGCEPVLRPVSIPEILNDSIAFILDGRRLNARLRLPADLWPVKADRGQLSQVLDNLLINAKESMPDGGCLHIEANNIANFSEPSAPDLFGAFVKLTVRDEGPGIPTELTGRIFDPYFSTKKTGIGLGLAIVHGIVTKHNGHINVSSREGEGTTFAVYLPASSEVVSGGRLAERDCMQLKSESAHFQS